MQSYEGAKGNNSMNEIDVKNAARTLLLTDIEANPRILTVLMDIPDEQARSAFRSILKQNPKRARRLKTSDDRVIAGKKPMRIEASLFGVLYEILCAECTDMSADMELFTLMRAYQQYKAMRLHIPAHHEQPFRRNVNTHSGLM